MNVLSPLLRSPFLALMLGLAAHGAAPLGSGFTAPASSLDGIGFPPIGRIAARSAHEIAGSDWSVGCEVLDRDFARYAAYKQYLAPLGAKAVRLQAGWAKTEKEKGKYDWPWLDDIVDDALAQGTQPWLELSYGNPIYTGGGGKTLGDGAPTSPEALAAWDHWAEALVHRYRDRVHEWEIWNEPDGSKRITVEQYVELFIRTATIIRAEQPKSRIYALALAGRTNFAREFLRMVDARGKIALVDAITFHGYPHNPDDLKTWTDLRAIVAGFSHAIELRQGETGAPSTKTTGALAGFEWNETKQAKWDLRRMLAHHGHGIPYNLFTLSDFYYPQGLNAKGLLQARADLSIVGPKPAYFAAQNVFAIFDRSWVVAPEKTVAGKTADRLAAYVYENATSHRHLVTLWFSGQPPVESSSFVPVDVTIAGVTFAEPVYVDLRTGGVFAIPANHVSQNANTWEFRGVPLYDSPIVIASRADLPLMPREN